MLAVLTGADWQASGYGDLPVPGGYKRRDGSPLYRPRYPALVKDRVRWVGDCVAFVVAETYHQAADAAELIEVDYETLPAAVSAADAIADGAPLVHDDCPNNICFVQLEGDNQIAFTGNQPVTVNADGLFDMNGHTQTLAQLNINDGMAETGNNGNLTLTPNLTLGATVLTMTSGGTTQRASSGR